MSSLLGLYSSDQLRMQKWWPRHTHQHPAAPKYSKSRAQSRWSTLCRRLWRSCRLHREVQTMTSTTCWTESTHASAFANRPNRSNSSLKQTTSRPRHLSARNGLIGSSSMILMSFSQNCYAQIGSSLGSLTWLFDGKISDRYTGTLKDLC